jgi:hypothetical protein
LASYLISFPNSIGWDFAKKCKNYEKPRKFGHLKPIRGLELSHVRTHLSSSYEHSKAKRDQRWNHCLAWQ